MESNETQGFQKWDTNVVSAVAIVVVVAAIGAWGYMRNKNASQATPSTADTQMEEQVPAPAAETPADSAPAPAVTETPAATDMTAKPQSAATPASETSPPPDGAPKSSAPTPTPSPSPSPTKEPTIRTFAVSGTNFSFTPVEMRVKKGDTVKVSFTNQSGFHDFVLDEFKVRTPRLGAGETATVSFAADRAGTFEYYCSVGQHRQMGMRGSIIVE